MKNNDALDALDRLENDALSGRDGYGDVRKDAEIIRNFINTRPQPSGDAVERATIVEAVGKILRSCNETDWASRRFAMAEWIADSVIKTLGDKINVK